MAWCLPFQKYHQIFPVIPLCLRALGRDSEVIFKIYNLFQSSYLAWGGTFQMKVPPCWSLKPGWNCHRCLWMKIFWNRSEEWTYDWDLKCCLSKCKHYHQTGSGCSAEMHHGLVDQWIEPWRRRERACIEQWIFVGFMCVNRLAPLLMELH